MNPRESAAFIASIAQDVKIDPLGIQNVAKEIVRAVECEEFKPNNLYIHSYPLPIDGEPASIEWLFVADVLNFSFWQLQEDQHYTVELKGIKYTGYMALCAALTKALEVNKEFFLCAGIPITTSTFYANITADDITKIFASATQPIPLPEDRLKNLQEAGKVLNDKFGGSFCNCVKQANQSAQQLLTIIVDNFPCFRDEAIIGGKTVSLYKRAQILVADIWGLFKGEGLGKFDDIDTITMFADYRVPQTLIKFGALQYTERLYELLNKNHLFENGDREEVEIRGCSIHAVELIRDEIEKNHRTTVLDAANLKLNSSMIDFFLWEYRRRFAKELARIPYHKCRCIFY
uniref:Queuosine 5'-phosphate N-glycosylase/hydrolase n=1 Tax=Eubosmina coregoni TaxID=186181 RepID=A0A4Y7LMV1_9CRUS|nr:EOG090X0A16 [Eubosmina coregoni]